MTSDTVTDALTMAWIQREPAAGLNESGLGSFKNERYKSPMQFLSDWHDAQQQKKLVA